MDDVISSIRGLFQYFYNTGMIVNSHWLLLAAPRCRDHRVRDGLSAAETKKLLQNIPKDAPDGKRYFAAIALAVFTGLCAGDIASLEFGDIDWK